MTLNQAAQQYAEIGELKCQDLDDANQEARQDELNTTDEQKEGFALTTAQWKPANGPGVYLKATSVNREDCVREEFRDGYSDKVDSKTKPACMGGGNYNPHRKNDSETKLLDPLMRPPMAMNGTVRMKIFHVSNGVADELPCGSCRRSICGAEACGIKIELCNNKNEVVHGKDLCKNGAPKDTTDAGWRAMGFGPKT
jgi:hypothetical protein